MILVDAHIDEKVRSVSCNSSMSKCNKTEDDEEYSKVKKMKMVMVVMMTVMMRVMMMVMMMVITTSRCIQKNAMTNMKISIHNMMLQENMKIVEHTIQFSGILSKS